MNINLVSILEILFKKSDKSNLFSQKDSKCLGCSMSSEDRVLFIEVLKVALGREVYEKFRNFTQTDQLPGKVNLLKSLPPYDNESEERAFCINEETFFKGLISFLNNSSTL